MSQDQLLPFNLLSDEQQRLVNAYVDWKVAQLAPDAKVKMADFRLAARNEVCTREGLKKLEEMEWNQEGPFAPKNASEGKPAKGKGNDGAADRAALERYLGSGGLERFDYFMQGKQGKGDKGQKR